VDTLVTLHRRSGGEDGYRGDLPLERGVAGPIIVDARRLGACHPMFLIRLRLFVDWHVSIGHEVRMLAPEVRAVAGHLATMDFTVGLPSGVLESEPLPRSSDAVLGIQRLHGYADVEDVANRAVDALRRQTGAIAGWGDAIHMAIGELCDNALQHGRNDLGGYVATDRWTSRAGHSVS
jgi:hypothetical protein